MQLNVSQLLSTNSSRDTLSRLLTAQHTVLLPINLASAALNGAALLIVYRSKNLAGMVAAILLSLSFVNLLNSLAMAAIDVLYFTGTIGCSGNCEMTFDPDPDASPGITVTLLRFSSDVCRSGFFWQMLLSAVHQWLLMTSPLRSEVINNHKAIFFVKVCVWAVCLLAMLPILVEGVAFGSDRLYFVLRVYVMPLVQTIHTAIVFLFYYKLACIAIRQIGEIAKVEELQTRFHPNQTSLKKFKARQNRKNAYVIQLIFFFLGPFVATISPGIFYRAFRPDLPPDFSTVRTLLVLDVLPAIHFLLNILLIGVLNKPFKRILQQQFWSGVNLLCERCCCCCCSCISCEQQRNRVNHSNSIGTTSSSTEQANFAAFRTPTESNGYTVDIKTHSERCAEDVPPVRSSIITSAL